MDDGTTNMDPKKEHVTASDATDDITLGLIAAASQALKHNLSTLAVHWPKNVARVRAQHLLIQHPKIPRIHPFMKQGTNG